MNCENTATGSRPGISERCLVCNSPTTSSHYGIIACRACAAFFRRSVTDNKKYKCGSNGQCNIYKDIRTCCRKCRLEKCYEVGMAEKHVQGKRDTIGLKAEDPSPLCVSRCETSEKTLKGKNTSNIRIPQLPSTSYCSVVTPESTSVESIPKTELLTKMRDNYRELCVIRRSAEIALNPDYDKTVEREGPLVGLCFITAAMGSLFFRSRVPAIIEFLAKSFHEFGMLNDKEKWTLLRPFLVAFGWVDNSYKTSRRVPKELFTRICIISETTYFDADRSDEWVATIGEGANESKTGVSGVFKRIMQSDRLKAIQALHTVNLQDEEYMAHIALLFWNTCVQDQTENLKRLVAQVRSTVLEELHNFEKLNNGQSAAARYGQVLDLSNVTVMELHRCRDSLELYTILDVIDKNDLFYEMVESIK